MRNTCKNLLAILKKQHQFFFLIPVNAKYWRPYSRQQPQQPEASTARIRDHETRNSLRSAASVLLCGSVSRLFRGDSFFTARCTAVMDASTVSERARSNSRESRPRQVRQLGRGQVSTSHLRGHFRLIARAKWLC